MPSAALNSPNDSPKRPRFADYELIARLAESALSRLFLVRARDPGTPLFVLKTPHPRWLREGTGDRNLRELFRREIETSTRLTHPNLLRIHDHGENRGYPYLVMEWVDGKNLRQTLMAQAPLPRRALLAPEATFIVREIAGVLNYTHSYRDAQGEAAPVIHCDLSPHNVLISKDGKVKVIDFGSARTPSRECDTLSDDLRGKAAYLSPEQAVGKGADPRSDLFSLGSIYWELLTGKKLFDGENDFVILEKVKNADVFLASALGASREIPREITPILVKCLRQDPADRYPSAAALLSDLRALPFAGDFANLRIAMTKIFPPDLEIDSRHLSGDFDENPFPELRQAAEKPLRLELAKVVASPPPLPEKPPRDFFRRLRALSTPRFLRSAYLFAGLSALTATGLAIFSYFQAHPYLFTLLVQSYLPRVKDFFR